MAQNYQILSNGKNQGLFTFFFLVKPTLFYFFFNREINCLFTFSFFYLFYSGTGDEACGEGYQEVACSNFCGRTKEYDPPSKLRDQSFTSLMANLRQGINKVSSFSSYLNGTFL